MADLDVEYPLAVTPEELARGAERSFSWQDGHHVRSLRLTLPAGATAGTRLRFAGQGRSGGGGQVGDLYLRLQVQAGPDGSSGARAQTRLAGFVLLALGLFLMAWTEYTARTEGTYRVVATLLGPLVAVVGAGIMIHAPRLPIMRPGPRENVYAVTGALLGVVNLYRFGAFDAGSEALVPILAGVASIGLYQIYRWMQTSSSK